MATGPQQKRKELREKRLQAEAAAKGADKRQNLFKIVGIAVFAVVIAIVAVVLISSGGSDSGGGGGDNAQAQLDGIAQNGSTLGDPEAAVTLVEFGDLQCPVCKQYATDILPDVITGPVKNGTANFDFQNWAILGPESALAAKAALAAGEQNRMWNFIEAFYANQGIENTGYVTDEFLTDIAEDAGIPDIDKWNEDREKPALEEELASIDETASGEGFSGTPSFAIRDADGALTPINDTQSSEAIIKAINEAAKTSTGNSNDNK
ncbi:MAG: thioredoxin domain-containing protein [Solirubrobacterales bacterium]|nr:thioredoxin domain-containing protein [Solirubrobacterales bacterium]HMT06226.1 thioredoxin domain-containing protein [Solirubrobacterales bacterium]